MNLKEIRDKNKTNKWDIIDYSNLKYKYAIVNKTKMYIDNKRNYITKYESNMVIEGITPVVETVINNIKYILSKGEM